MRDLLKEQRVYGLFLNINHIERHVMKKMEKPNYMMILLSLSNKAVFEDKPYIERGLL